MTPFMKIDQACAVTGLSRYYLRNGCKDGTVPHVKSGKTYMVNVPALLNALGVDTSALQLIEPSTKKPSNNKDKISAARWLCGK